MKDFINRSNVNKLWKCKKMDDTLEKKWFPLYTRSRFEKIAFKNLLDAGFEAYLPLKKTVRQWSDRKQKVEIPVFSSYVFARISKIESLKVLNIRGVVNYIHFNGQPASIRDKDIELFDKLLKTETKIEIVDGLPELGEEITISDGLLKGYTGKVAKIDKNTILIEIESFNKKIFAKISI